MLLFDLVPPQELVGYVRGVELEVNRNKFTLSQILPNKNIDDIEYRFTKGQFRDEDAAEVRAWDTEASIATRQGLSRVMGELPPISRKIRLGEEERLRKRKLETGSNAALVDAIYNDAKKMARAVAARIELLRGEALEKGSITLNENGVKQSIPFGRSAAHDPAALSGGALFSAHSTATPIAQIRADCKTYRDTNGIMPVAILTSQDTIDDIVQCAEIRSLLTGLNTGTPAFVTQAVLSQVLSGYGLPPIFPYITKVRVSGTQVNVIDPTKYILLPPAGEPLGNTFSGTTAESIELAEAQQIDSEDCPGMVAVVDKTYDPVSTWTKAVGIALPVLANPDLTLVRKVR